MVLKLILRIAVCFQCRHLLRLGAICCHGHTASREQARIGSRGRSQLTISTPFTYSTMLLILVMRACPINDSALIVYVTI
jgi:hypothetical protein